MLTEYGFVEMFVVMSRLSPSAPSLPKLPKFWESTDVEDGLCSLSEVLSRRDKIMRDALAHGQRFSEVIAFCHFKWSYFGGRFGVNDRQTVGFQHCLFRGELYIHEQLFEACVDSVVGWQLGVVGMALAIVVLAEEIGSRASSK